MNREFDLERKKREMHIEFFIEKLYARFDYLFSEPLDEIRKQAVDKYLNTDLSYEDITKEMVSFIEHRKIEYENKKKASQITNTDLNEKRKNDISNLVAILYTQYKYLFHESLDELEKKALDKYLNTAMSIDDIQKDMKEIIRKLIEEDEKKKENQKDLNKMIEEKPVDANKENDKGIQYVKKEPENKVSAQSGTISIFNIGLALSIITTMILVAMILNVLLK